jgi:hypothetical protein
MKNALLILVAAGFMLPAQEPRTQLFERRVAPPDVLMQAPFAMEGAVQFIAHEGMLAGKTVKNAPYTAEAITETVQTLADGNRITRRSTSSIARDSEGRRRQESSMGAIGPWGVAGELPAFVTIDDPVAKVHYLLNPKDRTVRKMELPGMHPMAGRRVHAERDVAVNIERKIEVAGGAPHAVQAEFRQRLPHAGKEPARESLGTRDIEGVKAEGTRTVLRIEAGEIGNERAIEVTSERWYSPELQVVVMSKHSDPRFGETTYKLTKIDRREPPPTLFQPPPDYKLEEGPAAIRRKLQHE